MPVSGMTDDSPQPSRMDPASTPVSSSSCVRTNNQGTSLPAAHAHASCPQDFNASPEMDCPVRIATLKNPIGRPLKMYSMPLPEARLRPGQPRHMSRQASRN